jgi:hypothetical protein
MFIGSEEAGVVLNGINLTGLTDVSFSSTINEEAVVLLADRGINRKINRGHVIDCKISKTYMGKDRLQEFTGITNLSGQFQFGTGAIDFNEASISSYSIDVGIQKAPQVSVNMKIFGDFKPAVSKASFASDYVLEDLGIDPATITLENRQSLLQEFSFSVNFDVKPTFEISSVKSTSNKLFSPITYNAKAKLLVDEQEFIDVTGLLESENFNRSVSLSLQNTGSSVLNTYTVPNASLKSQSTSIAAGDLVEMSVEYLGLDLNV